MALGIDNTSVSDEARPSIQQEKGLVPTVKPGLGELPPTSSPRSRITLKQWLQVLSTFLVFVNTWGLLLAFGAFQAYYEQVLLSDHSSSNISWISTTCGLFLFSVGAFTGPLYDYGFYTALLLFGSLLQIFGLMMISLSTQYYQLFLSQAICVGLGAGLAFTPSISAAAACFTSSATRARFMGLMACGGSVGGTVYPIMFRALVTRTGFAWAVRSVAFVALGLYLVSYLVLINNSAAQSKVRRQYFDFKAFIDWPFMVMCIASMFSAIAYYIPLLFLPSLTQIRIPDVDPDLASNLVAIVNGASAVGRILSGIVAAKFGPTETLTVTLMFASIILFCWQVVDSVAGTIVWSIFWGMTSGALVSLPGAIVPLLSPSLAVIGARSGMYWAWVGLGLLIGSPIGGALYDQRPGETDWWRLQVFAGSFMMAAALLIIYPIVHLRRRRRAATIGQTVELGR